MKGAGRMGFESAFSCTDTACCSRKDARPIGCRSFVFFSRGRVYRTDTTGRLFFNARESSLQNPPPRDHPHRMVYSSDADLQSVETERVALTPQLKPILPKIVAPTLPPSVSAPLLFLKTIDHVEINEVVKRGGDVTYYTLDVFLVHHSTRIPTSQSRNTLVSHDKPDYHIERRYSDFAKLRHQVWSCAQRKHDESAVCGYCDTYMHFIVHSMSQPRTLVKLTTGVKRRKQILAAFCNEFIGMAIAGSRLGHLPCHSDRAIPRILERFFHQ